MKYRLRATRTQRYHTRMLQAGEEFETSSAALRKIYLSKGGVEDVTDEPLQSVQPKPAEPEPAPPSQPVGPTRSDIYRMRKDELVEFISAAGEDVDEDDSVSTLRDQALALV